MKIDANVRPLRGTQREHTPVVGRIWQALWATALALSLAACGDDEAAQPAAPTAAATLGAAGGTLVGPDGVELVVPPGALSADTELRITKTSAGAPGLPSEASATTPVYEFTPHGLLFAKPVTLRMPFTPPTGAAAADIFMAGPGGEWSPVEAVIADGKAEWQRTSLSFGAGLACVISGGNTDPFACVWPTLGAALSATPSAALESLSSRHWRVTQTATLHFDVRVTAARDCADPRLVVTRLAPGQPAQQLVDAALALSPNPTDATRSVATYAHDLPLAHTDSGNIWLNHRFECTRPGQATAYASQQVLIQVDIPAPSTDVAPAVVTAPQDVTVTAPAAATFSAAASGSPAPSVQWQRSGDGGNTWSDIAGATATSYTTGTTSAADNGARFRAVFSNTAGSVNSASATLTVITLTGPQASVLRPTDGAPGAGAIVAAASGGRFLAVWVVADRTTGQPTFVRASRYTKAGGWSTGVDIASVSTDVHYSISAALGEDGTAVVAWLQPSAGKDSAWYVRQSPGGAWSSPALVEADDSDGLRSVKVVADATGTVTAVWNTGVSLRPHTYASRLSAGSTVWSSPVELGLTNNGGSIAPGIAVASDGRVQVAFVDYDATNNTRVMVANRYVPGTGWSGPQILMSQSTTYIMTLGNVAIAGGYAAVAYQAVPTAGAGGRTMVSRWSPGGGWGTPDELPVGSAGSVTPSGARQVAVDANGRTSVVWDQTGFVSGNAVSEVYFAEATPGASFGAIERLGPALGYSAGPVIAADALGNLVVAWSARFTDLSGLRRPVGGTWGAILSWETLPAESDRWGPAGFALGADGDAAVAWIESAGTSATPSVSVWAP